MREAEYTGTKVYALQITFTSFAFHVNKVGKLKEDNYYMPAKYSIIDS